MKAPSFLSLNQHCVYRTPQLPLRHNQTSELFNYSQEPFFKEAIYIASPILYSELIKWHTGQLKDNREIDKLTISIYKYYTRMQSRCTPYGLFAGLGIVCFAAENSVLLDANIDKVLQRQTRLDMNVICSLAQELGKQESIKPYLKFHPNNSIYKIENFYRYVEHHYIDARRIHTISKVDFSDYLQLILTIAKDGKSLNELSLVLVSDEITQEDAESFITELVNSQLLISELEPNVTGVDFFKTLQSTLQGIYNNHPSVELNNSISSLQDIQVQLNKLDEKGINAIENYQTIFNDLKLLLPTISETNLFQTDLFKQAEASSINTEIQQSILSTISFFNKITLPYKNKTLEDFKNRFRERYEDSEIPFLQGLDTETGIGYPAKDTNGLNELIDDLYIFNSSNESEIKWNPLQAALHKLIIKSIEERKNVIEISEQDFEGIDYSDKSLPHSFSVMFKMLNAATGKIEINSLGGSSANNLIGRFGHGSTEIAELLKDISKHEEEQVGNSVLAEIAHLPESRVGNILARPVFRKYEIPYLAKSLVDKDSQLEASDLYISIKGDKIILRSKKLNKQIIPRLGNAHNFSFNSLPVYHFLCDLQNQYFNKPFLSFNWGALANQYAFLPRVEYKNVVLSPAKWQIQKKDFEAFLKIKNEEEAVKLFDSFKHTHKIPEMFLIADGDNELLIDTKQNIAILTFIDTLKNRQSINLEEFLFDTENPLVKDTNGNGFTNECIAIVLNNDNKLSDVVFNETTENKSKKQFSIGSEWLYYKIYSGVKTADYILTEKIKSITEYLLENNLIDKWFFIRYADPETHLRFRLHITDVKGYEQIITLINKALAPLLNQGVIFKLQTDTYARELERYGDNSIETSESLFFYDSVCCVDTLNLLDAEHGNTIRWQFALRATDQFLDDFGLTTEAKYELMNNFSQSFFMEHGGKKELKLQLDDKFRKLRKDVEKVLDRATDSEKEIFELIKIIDNRSLNNTLIIQNILELKNSNTLQVPFNNLLSSYIHMMLNRLFMAKQRTNEFVIYDLLSRHYKSDIARNKKQSANLKAEPIHQLQTG